MQNDVIPFSVENLLKRPKSQLVIFLVNMSYFFSLFTVVIHFAVVFIHFMRALKQVSSLLSGQEGRFICLCASNSRAHIENPVYERHLEHFHQNCFTCIHIIYRSNRQLDMDVNIKAILQICKLLIAIESNRIVHCLSLLLYTSLMNLFDTSTRVEDTHIQRMA